MNSPDTLTSPNITSPLNRETAYQSLCYVLSERAGLVEWQSFTSEDWELFAQLAKAEGVAPLMYWNLKDTSIEVPLATFDFLQSTYYQTLAHNTLLFQELERILGALDEAGIPVIVLKGAALAGTIYEDIGLRPMSDLDLLVRPDDLPKAIQAVRKVGYQIEKITYHVVFIGGVNSTSKVELHWCINPLGENYSKSISWFWDNTNPITSHGHLKSKFPLAVEFNNLSQLFHLILHTVIQHHDLSMVLRYHDIYQLVKSSSETIDISSVEKWANTLGLDNALVIALDILEKNFQISSISNPFIIDLDHKYDVKTSELEDNLNVYKNNISFANGLLDWQTRILAYSRLLIPNKSYINRRYHPNPGWIWPLYYPYRWLNIVFDLTRSVVKR